MSKHIFLPILCLSLVYCSRDANVSYYSDIEEQLHTKELITKKFIEDNSIISNPERGFCIRREYASNDNPISNSEINKLKQENHTLVFFDFKLGEFISKPISDNMFAMMQNNFDRLRTNGIKAIIRFAYSNSTKATIYDAEPSVVLNHIEQLKPFLEKNKDVIAVIEAGFIGAHGEWYYSTHYGNTNTPDYNKRRIIINAILNAFPKDRMIAVRTPSIKTNLLNISFNDTITESEAFNKSNKSRIAHHNDCFLADESDMGTFRNSADRLYTQYDSKYTSMGGETCTPPNSYSQCNSAMENMKKYHWSYLNMSYHPGIISDWKNTNCFDEIQKKLGYRFVMKEVSYSKEIVGGKNYNMILKFENKGFASPYNPRTAEIKFRSTSNGKIYYTHKLNSNPQFWFSGEHVIDETFTLPNHMPNDRYDLILSLPDASPSINSRPEYSIRLANIDTWEYNTGYNILFTQ